MKINLAEVASVGAGLCVVAVEPLVVNGAFNARGLRLMRILTMFVQCGYVASANTVKLDRGGDIIAINSRAVLQDVLDEYINTRMHLTFDLPTVFALGDNPFLPKTMQDVGDARARGMKIMVEMRIHGNLPFLHQDRTALAAATDARVYCSEDPDNINAMIIACDCNNANESPWKIIWDLRSTICQVVK